MLEPQILLEIFGYIGSFLVVFSMLMSSVVKLRIINTVGSVVSGTYALICGAYPLVLMNGCLIIINVYNLYKLLKTEQQYDMVESKKEDALLSYFLEKYRNMLGEARIKFAESANFIEKSRKAQAKVSLCLPRQAKSKAGRRRGRVVFSFGQSELRPHAGFRQRCGSPRLPYRRAAPRGRSPRGARKKPR